MLNLKLLPILAMNLFERNKKCIKSLVGNFSKVLYLIMLSVFSLSAWATPTISNITDKTITSSANNSLAIPFTIGDSEVPSSSLIVFRSGGGSTFPSSLSYAFSGTGSNRALTITAAPNESGHVWVTVVVRTSAGENNATNFIFTVLPGQPNTPPTITEVSDVTVEAGAGIPTIVTIPFAVSDAETSASSLTLIRSGGGSTFPSAPSYVFSGSGTNRTLRVTFAQNETGLVFVTLILTDPSGGTDTTGFKITVTPTTSNTAPTISNITNKTITLPTSFIDIPFTVSDAEDPLNTLGVFKSTGGSTFPNTPIYTITGSGSNRNLRITPVAGQTGQVTVTVVVQDGGAGRLTDSTQFVFTSQAPANTPPTITNITNKTVVANATTPTVVTVPFTISDAETNSNDLTLIRTGGGSTFQTAPNYVLSGNGSSRTLIATFAAGESGLDNVTLIVNDPQNASDTTGFRITLTPAANTPPTITNIVNRTITQPTAFIDIPFTVNDAETPSSQLDVFVTLDGETFPTIPTYILSGIGTNRVLKITPVGNQVGSVTVTIVVQDSGTGHLTDSTQFEFSAQLAPNTPPTMSNVTDKMVVANATTPTVITIPFAVDDAETPANSLNVSKTVGGSTFATPPVYVLGGTGANRTLTATFAAGESGLDNVTLLVNDPSGATGGTGFRITVTPAANTAPTISNITNKTVAANTLSSTVVTVPFTIADAETQANELELTLTGGPKIADYVITGTGSSRTLTATFAVGESGTDGITLVVFDLDGASDNVGFNITVTPAENTSPTISSIANKTITRPTALIDIPFTVGDAQTPLSQLDVFVTLDGSTFSTTPAYILSGTGASRVLRITPVANQAGSVTVTVVVQDNGTERLTDSTQFVFTTEASANTAPVITEITDKTVVVNTTGSTVVTIPFAITDTETPTNELNIIRTGGGSTFATNPIYVLSGTGSNRTLTVTFEEGESGLDNVTLVVSDSEGRSDTTGFRITVTPVENTPATISEVTDKTAVANATSPTVITILFTIDDAETPANNLNVSLTGGGSTFATTPVYVLGGTGANRTLTATFAAGESGLDNVTLLVNDPAGGTGGTGFRITVEEAGTGIEQIFDQGTDIGNVDAAGNYSFDPNTGNYTVVGSGRDIWGSSDEFYYNYTEVTGDFDVIAKVDAFAVDNAWGKAGFMIRDDLTGVSMHASMFLTNSHGAALQARAGESLGSTNQGASGYSEGTWLRLVRAGDVLTGYASANGSLWEEIQSLTINFSNTAYLGFAVTAHQDGSFGTAQFSQLSLENSNTEIVNQAPLAVDDFVSTNQDTNQIVSFVNLLSNDTDPNGDLLLVTSVSNAVNGQVVINNNQILFTPSLGFSGSASFTYEISDGNGGSATAEVTVAVAPISNQNVAQIFDQGMDVGEVAASGNYMFDSTTGNYIVEGSGRDIWGSRDEFYYNYTEVTGDFEATAKVNSFAVVNGWGKAGFMLREDLTDVSMHASTFLTNNYGVAFQSRAVAASGSGNQRVAGYSEGSWIRLVRTGNVLVSYASNNGISWEEVGTRTISFSNSVYLGFAVTAHEDGAIATAQFSNLSVEGGGLVLLNEPPEITTIPDRVIADGQASTNSIIFEVADAETPASELSVTVFSSNIGIISIADIKLGGTVTTRSIEVFASAGQPGSADITVTVRDAEGASSATRFTVTVESGGGGVVGGGGTNNGTFDPGAITSINPSADSVSDGIYNGALSGAHSVGNDGSFNYSVPIKIPVGVNGMQPNLSLNYNSNRRNGLLGYGWSLGGLSVISRCKAQTVRDGYMSSTNAGDNYKYCLDGQRLVEVANGEYRTEKETFVRIFKEQNYWHLVNNAGMETRYGFNDDAKIEDSMGDVYSWYIDQRKDVAGNFYEIAYEKSGATAVTHRPKQITYTKNNVANPALNTNQTIEFEYEVRPDSLTHYRGGVPWSTHKRLSAILMKTGGQRVWRYALNYQKLDELYDGKRFEDPAKTSRLYEVSLCYQFETQCAESLVFNWSAQTDDMYVYEEDRNAIPGWNGENANRAAQLLLHIDNNGTLDPYFDIVNAEHVSYTLRGGPDGGGDIVGESEHLPRYHAVDINGDGFTDVVKIFKVKDGLTVFLNIEKAGGGREISETSSSAYGLNENLFHWDGVRNYRFLLGANGSSTPSIPFELETKHVNETQLIDVNNDGLIDLVLYATDCTEPDYECNGGGQNELNVLFNTGNGWYEESGVSQFHNMGTVNDEFNYQFIDLNEDGLVDLFGNLPTSGDGGTAAGSHVKLNTGNGQINNGTFQLEESWRVGLGFAGPVGLLGDFNGDGILDSALMTPYTTEINVRMGMGNLEYADEPGAPAHANNVNDLLSGCTQAEVEATNENNRTVCLRSVFDFNGDGLDDIIVQTAKVSTDTCSRGTEGCGLDGREISTHSSTIAQVYISQGGAALGNVRFAAPITYRTNSSGKMPGKDTTFFVDINGDGFKEDSTLYVHNTEFLGHKMVGIQSSMGEIVPKYTLLKEPSVLGVLASGGTNTTNIAQQSSKKSRRLGVQSVVRNNLANAQVAKDSYTFSGSVYQRGGWGNLGFGRITKVSDTFETTGLNSRIKTDTTYYQVANAEYKLNGFPQQKVVTLLGVNPVRILSDTHYQWKVRTYSDDIDSAANSPHYFPYLIKSSTRSWDANGTKISDKVTHNASTTNFSCAAVSLNENGLDPLVPSLVVAANSANDTDYTEHGVLNYTSTVTCDATTNSGAPTENTVQIQAAENLDIITQGNKRGLIRLHKQYAWQGSNVTAANSANLSVRTTGLTYTPLGQLKDKETEPTGNGSLNLVTSHTYNTYGSVDSITEQWNSLPNDGLPNVGQRTTTLTESWSGAVRTVITNSPILPAETTVYHPIFGLPTSHTDVNGLTTNLLYDALGRESTITHTDGKVSNLGYYQCNDCTSPPPNINAAWYKTSKTTGTPTSQEGFDEFGRPVYVQSRKTNGERKYQTTSYNNRGLVVEATDWFTTNSGQKKATHTVYDTLGRVDYTNSNDHTIAYLYDGLKTTIIQAPGTSTQTQTRYSNSTGQVLRSIDNAGTPVDFTYWPFGELKTTTVDNNANTTIRMFYDNVGRKTQLTDPNAGLSSYTYNALGLISSQTDANQKLTRFGYDLLGRQTDRTDDATGTSRSHAWQYDNKPKGEGMLGSMSGFNTDGTPYAENYSYTSVGLPKTSSRTFGGQTYTVTQHYDTFNRPLATTYPSGFTTYLRYSGLGFVDQVKSFTHNDKVLWTLNETDAFGNATRFTLGNGIETNQNFNPLTGYIENIQAGLNGVNIQNHSYKFDGFGNLEHREDKRSEDENIPPVLQTFGYNDGMNRLTDVVNNKSSNESFSFDALGNIKTKAGISGTMTYGTVNNAGSLSDAGPHAVVAANGLSYSYDNAGNVTTIKNGSVVVGSVQYSAFNKPTQITNNGNTTNLVYGANQSRTKRVDSNGKTTTYGALGLYEIKSSLLSTEIHHYIGDFAVYIEKSGAVSASYFQYLHRDHLGSVVARSGENIADITNEEISSYGVWGERRFDAWDGVPEGDEFIPTDSARGFTDHEHLDGVGLIHMNGRVYDPTLGRFLSADPLIQAPLNSQSYNRYSYVFNNPLSFVDPSGFACAGARDGRGCDDTIPDVYAELGRRSLTTPEDFNNYNNYRSEYSRDIQTNSNYFISYLNTSFTNGFDAYIGVSIAGCHGDKQCIDAIYEGGAIGVSIVTPIDDALAVLAVGGLKGLKFIKGLFESLKVAKGVPKPSVVDPKLNNLVKDLYKGANTKKPIGTGSTADAIRREAATGQPVGGKFHTDKGQQYVNALNKWLKKNQNASASDRSAAQSMLDDLNNALGGGK